jgi:phage host-nuclease inhibitor protein Gam
MNTKRQKVAAIEHYVPQSRDEVNEAIAELGRGQRERLRIETAMNDEIAAIKAKHEAAAKPIGDRISELTKGIALWCEANRSSLTRDGKVKFHEFATGVVNWRKRPHSIVARGVDAVLAILKQRGLKQFIRTTETIDKDAMLKTDETRALAATIPGVKVDQKEDFVVKPLETNLEEVQS